MPETFIYILFLIFFFVLEILYFKIAHKYKIIDVPNERSSHRKFTIRGGGAIFPVAALFWYVLSGFQSPFFIAALLIISVISFIDDIEHIHTKVRFVFQLFAVALMLYQVPIQFEWYLFPFVFVMLVGTINAYNFMDGINGITGLYSISVLLSLLWVNVYEGFIDARLIIFVLLALLVFGFFNFRKKAKCFAGDIGSVSIAFIICYLILMLVTKTGNFIYILFLLVYGLDAATTMFFRVIRKENILEAHRSHFYQYLANEKKLPHLVISFLYAIVQFLFNILLISLISSVMNHTFIISIVISVIACILFVFFRFSVEGKDKLLSANNLKDYLR